MSIVKNLAGGKNRNASPNRTRGCWNRFSQGSNNNPNSLDFQRKLLSSSRLRTFTVQRCRKFSRCPHCTNNNRSSAKPTTKWWLSRKILGSLFRPPIRFRSKNWAYKWLTSETSAVDPQRNQNCQKSRLEKSNSCNRKLWRRSNKASNSKRKLRDSIWHSQRSKAVFKSRLKLKFLISNSRASDLIINL